MSMARALSQRHTVHGHRKIIASLDATFACFHKDMDELIHAHPPRETEPHGIVVWLLFKAHSGARRAARLWQEYFRNEVLMSAGWNAEATEPKCAPRKPRTRTMMMEACTGTRTVSWWSIKVDINVSTVIGTDTKILKQVSSWKPAGITWVRVEPRAEALAPNTAAKNIGSAILGSSYGGDHWLVALQSISYPTGLKHCL